MGEVVLCAGSCVVKLFGLLCLVWVTAFYFATISGRQNQKLFIESSLMILGRITFEILPAFVQGNKRKILVTIFVAVAGVVLASLATR
ncbi:MAG: hypothetical protein WC827_00500 [Candidatus Paceibacterota bacterium]|jgi:hypothetical protein